MPTPTPSMLRIRKLADTSEGERIKRYDPETGEKILINPATPGDDHEAWPLLGVQIEGDTPARCRVSTTFVQRGLGEKWLEVEGGTPVVHPAGAPGTEWSKPPHVFLQADAIVLKCIDGDVRYSVTHQPNKYDDSEEPAGYRIDHFYDLTLEA